jgi:hypothetical protein
MNFENYFTKMKKALKTVWCQGFLAFYTEGVMEALKLFIFTTTSRTGIKPLLKLRH